MKTTNVKGLAVKGFTGALAIGALFFAGNANAHAQGLAVGVQFGGPAYAAPAAAYYAAPGYYSTYGYYDGRRAAFDRHEAREMEARHDAIIRHEQWEHARDFDRRFDRDDHRWR